jgi:hypothetical protein
MKPTISEFKRSVLSDYIKQLDSEVSTLYHSIEENENISEETWRVYEKMLDQIFYLIGQVSEEIYFS